MLVVSVADRAAFSVAVPSTVAPSKNVTAPVGVPAPGGGTLTVAVNATTWPITGEVVDDATVVVVGALSMVSLSGTERLLPKIRSPA